MPLISGIMILPIAITISGTSVLSGYYIKETGRYLGLIRIGMALLIFGFGLLIDLDQKFSFGRCVAFEVVAALGIGPGFLSPLVALQRQLQQEDIASATSTFSFVHNVAAAMSVALGGVVFQHGIENHLSTLQQTLDTTLASKFSGFEAGANINLISSLPPNQKIIVQSAYAAGLRNIWILNTSVATLGLFSSSLILEKHFVIN